MTDTGTDASSRALGNALGLSPSQHVTIRKPPFPYFGGKSRVAPLVWQRLGDISNYVEPFFGSGAVLFHRPTPPRVETVNDKDGFIANFFRALQHDPEGVARYADHPVNENDLHARHLWLVNQKSQFVPRLEGNPDFYDVKIAGFWVWGICCWIGGGFASGRGPWQEVDGQLVDLGNAGQGISRRRVHLGAGRGIERSRVHLKSGQGINRKREDLSSYFAAFAARLRTVRVCCGDWTRVLGESPTTLLGLTGVFLDPPYSADANRSERIYQEDDMMVAHAVRKWAITNGDNPLLRIAYCSYDNETMPASWDMIAWKAGSGYGSQGNTRGRANASRERIWFSPHCLKSTAPQQYALFPDPNPNSKNTSVTP